MTHPSSRLVRVGAAALVAALAGSLTACAGSSSSDASSTPATSSSGTTTSPATGSPSASPTTPPPAPANRACYRLGYDDAVAPTNDSDPVPCDQRHTAITFYVGRLPQHAPVDGDRVHRLVSQTCPQRFASFVGGSVDARRLSLLRTVWFTPTLAQWQAGDRWYRCEAIALLGDQRLAPLTGRLQGVLAKPLASRRFALCGTAQPGTTGFQQTVCGSPHAWRALRVVPLAQGRYPGVDAVKSAGQSTCQAAAADVAGNPLDYEWSYQWPTLTQWRAGQTYGLCWAPDTSTSSS